MRGYAHPKQDSSSGDLPVELSAPAQRALAGAGISRLEQLATMSERQIKGLHGIGPKAIRQLRDALAAKGLSFASVNGE